jgi:hypothetical protein
MAVVAQKLAAALAASAQPPASAAVQVLAAAPVAAPGPAKKCSLDGATATALLLVWCLPRGGAAGRPAPHHAPPRGGAAISSQHRSAGSDDTMADEPPLGPIMNHAARCGGVVPAIDRRSCSPIRRLLTGDCCETSGWLHGCTSHMQPVEACLPAGDRLMAQPVGPRWVVSERLPAPGRTEKRSAYRGPCTHDMYAYGSLLESSM